MIAARRLVIVVVVAHEGRGVLGERVDDAAGALVGARRVVASALLGEGPALGLSLFGAVVGVKVKNKSTELVWDFS